MVIVSFSGRKNGNCEQISRYIAEQVGGEIFSFADFSIEPCGKCEYECFKDRERCPHIEDMEVKLLEAITESDVAYFVIPNYCDYPNANFFIFNERSQCYFQGRPEILEKYLRVSKKVVVISNTGEENFRKAMEYQAEEEPKFLFLVAKEFGKKSIDGDLMSSEAVRERIKNFING